MTQLNSKYDTQESHIFMCDAGDNDALIFSWEYDPRWTPDEVTEGYLEITEQWRPYGFKGRLSTAFKALRGKPFWTNGVILKTQDAIDLRDALNGVLARIENNARAKAEAESAQP